MTGIERLRDIAYDGPYSGGMVHISVHKLREICEQIEAEGGAETVKSEAMDALAFVDEHGGLDEVKKRLMPKGMEWPKFEDGETVEFGDKFRNPHDGVSVLSTVTIKDCCGSLGGDLYWRLGKGKNAVILKSGERVKRPAPKVLDADGVEIHVGDKLYYVKTGCSCNVRSINADGTIELDGHENRGWRADLFIHRAPVLAADGKPLREGDMVWGTKGGSYHLTSVHDGKVFARYVGGSFGAEAESAGGEGLYRLRADQLTHERHDSWERLEEDAKKEVCKYFGYDTKNTCFGCPTSGVDRCDRSMKLDLVRRAKALAERGQ